MEKEYRIANIHAELLKSLSNGRGFVYCIDAYDVLKKKIRYERYKETDPIVCFLLENGIELLPAEKGSANTQQDIRNTISIREFINGRNGWQLDFFVRDLFYLAIRTEIECIKCDKHFSFVCRFSTLELSKKAYYISNTKSDDINNYLREEQYIRACESGAEQRWRMVMDNILLRKAQFLKTDAIFGLVYLFDEQYEYYQDYIFRSWHQCMNEL